MKILNIIILITAMSVLTSCYTVQGAFKGAGHDTRAAAHAMQLD